jgi:hypothetical protein
VRQCGPIHAGMHLPADEHRAAVVEPQPRERCPYLMRDAIRGHQRQSEAIRGDQRQSEAIRGDGRR